jgi:hypothetical protein
MRHRLLWERLNGRRGLSTLSFCVEIGPGIGRNDSAIDRTTSLSNSK